MAKRSEILKLPDEVRKDLDQRLRESAYGEYVWHAAWLDEQGYEISKSALHRYGQTLRQVDASNGLQEAQVAEQRIGVTKPIDVRRRDLFLELGRLRHEETKILQQLDALEREPL